MASTPTSLWNTTTAYRTNTTTKPHNSELCLLFPKNVHSEILDSFSVPYIVNAALNVPLVIVTTVANLLVLLAMRNVTSLRLPSKLLLCSLVLTDLGVGSVVQPQYIVIFFLIATNPNSMRCALVESANFTGSLFTGASLLTITALSLDRHTALFFHLKYQTIVTTRRVCAVLIFIWMLSLFYASTYLWSKVLWRVLKITGVVISLLVISVAYIKIYWRLRTQHAGHQVQPQTQPTSNTLATYKKNTNIMAWICVIFIICYLPYFCMVIVGFIGEYTALTVCIWDFCFTVLLLNSCLNPFVYCLRLPEIRAQVKKQLRRFCCRSPQQ